MKNKIRIGIIGANPDRGWAATAHIPALMVLPQYEISAVSTSRIESAQAAAKKFHVPLAFDNHHDLVTHPDVDLVAVTVKVPHHYELASAALKAGKHVYCEWPLGNGTAEAEKLTALAAERGVIAVAGLQARFSPTVQYVHKLIQDGYIGRVLSTSVVATGKEWGSTVQSYNAYVLDERNSATMLTIAVGHMIDAFCWVLGEFESVNAVMATQYRQAVVLDSGQTIAKSGPDQIIISGMLQTGSAASIHYRGGQTAGTNFLWEINGTDGVLVMKGPMGLLQMCEPELYGARNGQDLLKPLPVPPEFRWAPLDIASPFAVNVAQVYARLAEDILTGTSHVPTFSHATARHRLLDDIQTAAAAGRRRGPGRRKMGIGPRPRPRISPPTA